MNLNIESKILLYLTYKNKIKYSRSIKNNKLLIKIIDDYYLYRIFKKIKLYKIFKKIIYYKTHSVNMIIFGEMEEDIKLMLDYRRQIKIN